MSIAFVDLKKQFKFLEKDIRSAIDGVLEHGRFIMGPEVGELEAELAKYVGVKHAIGCSSGTDALMIPLKALDVGPGDAILTTPFTFIATAEVISFLGARPVFVDIDAETFNIDTEQIEKTIERVDSEGRYNLKGIIPVDLFGLPADYTAINSIAKKRNLFVLEDAAQALGGQYNGQPAGSLGDVGATSFFPAKPLGCYGDGGAIFTNDDKLAEIMRSIVVHGKGTHKYDNVRVGINGRLDTFQAAILLVKLAALNSEIKKRQKVADSYTERLKDHLQTPAIPNGMQSAWAQYSILTDHRDTLQTALKEAGVPTAIYYPKPLHLQTAFAELGYKEGSFPVSESMSRRILNLPMHPYLTSEEIDAITDAVIKSVN